VATRARIRIEKSFMVMVDKDNTNEIGLVVTLKKVSPKPVTLAL
jgi:hypothetical protein